MLNNGMMAGQGNRIARSAIKCEINLNEVRVNWSGWGFVNSRSVLDVDEIRLFDIVRMDKRPIPFRFYVNTARPLLNMLVKGSFRMYQSCSQGPV